jgi:hypothetical protein
MSPIETRLVIAAVLALAAILLVAFYRGRLGAADARTAKTTVLALGATTAMLVAPAAIVLAIRAL